MPGDPSSALKTGEPFWGGPTAEGVQQRSVDTAPPPPGPHSSPFPPGTFFGDKLGGDTHFKGGEDRGVVAAHNVIRAPWEESERPGTEPEAWEAPLGWAFPWGTSAHQKQWVCVCEWQGTAAARREGSSLSGCGGIQTLLCSPAKQASAPCCPSRPLPTAGPSP